MLLIVAVLVLVLDAGASSRRRRARRRARRGAGAGADRWPAPVRRAPAAATMALPDAAAYSAARRTCRVRAQPPGHAGRSAMNASADDAPPGTPGERRRPPTADEILVRAPSVGRGHADRRSTRNSCGGRLDTARAGGPPIRLAPVLAPGRAHRQRRQRVRPHLPHLHRRARGARRGAGAGASGITGLFGAGPRSGGAG